MKSILFLQNAWSPLYAGRRWPRESWLKALKKSRSGQRLRHLIDDYSICHNTTTKVGDNPNSQFAPDDTHIRRTLSFTRPEVVIACGTFAGTALQRSWNGPLLIVPHPACRVLTNELYQQGRQLVEGGFEGVVELKQRRGFVETIHLSLVGDN